MQVPRNDALEVKEVFTIGISTSFKLYILLPENGLVVAPLLFPYEPPLFSVVVLPESPSSPSEHAPKVKIATVATKSKKNLFIRNPPKKLFFLSENPNKVHTILTL